MISLSLAIDQDRAEVVHVGARGTGDDEVAHGREGAIGVVLRELRLEADMGL